MPTKDDHHSQLLPSYKAGQSPDIGFDLGGDGPGGGIHWNGSAKTFVAKDHLNGELRQMHSSGDPVDMWC
jgi:hypothetical protein